jgi:hypothetical protein
MWNSPVITLPIVFLVAGLLVGIAFNRGGMWFESTEAQIYDIAACGGFSKEHRTVA